MCISLPSTISVSSLGSDVRIALLPTLYMCAISCSAGQRSRLGSGQARHRSMRRQRFGEVGHRELPWGDGEI